LDLKPAAAAPAELAGALLRSASAADLPTAADRRALRAEIAPRVAACGTLGRHARVTVRYSGDTGRISEVRIAGGHFRTHPLLAACIERAVRSARVAPFRRSLWQADYVFPPR
jgi:hypothetical protein